MKGIPSFVFILFLLISGAAFAEDKSAVQSRCNEEFGVLVPGTLCLKPNYDGILSQTSVAGLGSYVCCHPVHFCHSVSQRVKKSCAQIFPAEGASENLPNANTRCPKGDTVEWAKPNGENNPRGAVKCCCS